MNLPDQPALRIGTWNVERAAVSSKNQRRLEILRCLAADVWVLTETGDDLDLAPSHSAVHSDPRLDTRTVERMVTIWSCFPLVEVVRVRNPLRTAAALYDTPLGPLLVYGTVIAWHADRGPSGAESNWAEHYRAVAEQGKEWAELRRRYATASLCVAGDFNMNLGGPHYYGTKYGRALMQTALDGAGLVCATRTEHVPPGKLKWPPIDHVCLSAPLSGKTSVADAWPGTIDGLRLSDHSGLVVEVTR